jgi:phospholipid/cholesterol/gamma-HCH transport system substrate-binding protein
MSKQAPSAGRIISMVAFTGSCIGLLLFLWISFGGSIPLASQGYRISAEFNQAVELGSQADVRISGVNVGKVVSVSLDRRTGLTRAVMEIDRKYAPRPVDTRAILRSKTLLGETYIELSPGTQNGPKLKDGASLQPGQVAPTVQLDQILSTFDPATRQAFSLWQQQQGMALTNRGEDLNAAIAQLYPFALNVDSVLTVLNRDSAATTTLLHDGGQVFSALSSSPSQLQGFIRNSNAVFAATAARNTALANTVKAFPSFLVATRQTIDRLTTFANSTQPLVDELRPGVRALNPALQGSVTLAPELRDLLVNIGPLNQASKAGFPAFERFLNETVPFLVRAKPYLGGLIPVFDYINTYRREIAAFFANSTATTQATFPNIPQTKQLHYVRISNPVNPEVLTSYQKRLSSNRGNPYMAPGGFAQLPHGLSVFGNYLCTSNPQPTIGPSIPASLAAVLQSVYYTAEPGGPPCKAQGALGTLTTGQLQSFPHLTAIP